MWVQKGLWDFPGGPVVKTLRFQCRGMGSIPGQGTKIPHSVQCSQKTKKIKKKKRKGLCSEATLVLAQGFVSLRVLFRDNAA